MPAKLLTTEMFDRHWPDGDDDMIAGLIDTQTDAFAKFGIVTDLRLAHFMGQVSVECDDGERFTELLSYSHPRRLMAVYESHFPTLESALPYIHQPEKLANLVYNGRMGNRSGTDDGWKYRGRGYIQLTGLDNYRTIGLLTDLDLVGNPDLAIDPKHALAVTCAFWSNAKLNALADLGSVLAVTKRVNGGVNGLSERTVATSAWKAELGI